VSAHPDDLFCTCYGENKSLFQRHAVFL